MVSSSLYPTSFFDLSYSVSFAVIKQRKMTSSKEGRREGLKVDFRVGPKKQLVGSSESFKELERLQTAGRALKSQLGGSRSQLGGPWNQLGGPLNQLEGPQSQLGGP